MPATPIPMPPRVYPDVGTVFVHGGSLHWLFRENHKSLVCDLATGQWSPAVSEPFPYRREHAVLAHADGEVILWGGSEKRYTYKSSFVPKSDGARLCRDGVWRPIASKGAPSSRVTSISAWTGKELLVWGGRGKSLHDTGGAYDPATDTWRKLSTKDAPSARSGCESVWTGTELLVWGGHDFSARFTSGGYREEGYAYDPAKDAWRRIASQPSSTSEQGTQRDTVWLGDKALFLRRDYVIGSDIDTLSVFTYDPTTDTFTSVAAPPEIRGGYDPELYVFGGRTLLVLGTMLLEYVPARDVWVRHEDLPTGYGTKLFELGEELLAFDLRQCQAARLTLPQELPPALAPKVSRAATVDAPAAEVAVEDPVSESALQTRLKALTPEPAVSAAAISDANVAVGHVDGRVSLFALRAGESRVVEDASKTLRDADGRTVHGLALEADRVLCLLGERLETRAHDGALLHTLKLPEAGHALDHRAGTLVVASSTSLFVIDTRTKTPKIRAEAAIAKRGWAVRTVAIAQDGARVLSTLVQRAAPKATRQVDVLELRALDTLAFIASHDAKSMEPGTAAGVLVESDAPAGTGKKKAERVSELILAGGGSYDLHRIPLGKKRKTGTLRSESGWNARLVLSADGTRVATTTANLGVELFDVKSGRAEMTFELFDHEDWDLLAKLVPPLSFLAENEREPFKASTRTGGGITVMALDARGERGVVGSGVGAAFVFGVHTAAIDVLSRGKASVWQPGTSAILTRQALLAGGANVEEGRAELVLADGTYVEIDAETGETERFARLDVARIRGLRDYEHQCIAVRRHGEYVVVGAARADVFHARTGAPVPEAERPAHSGGKGVWTVRKEGSGHVLVKLDAVSLREVKTMPLPATPATSTLLWLGAERWLVDLTETPGAMLAQLSGTKYVVDAEHGTCTPLDASAAVETFDGAHFAVPLGNGNAWRRWQIFGEDLSKPVRTLVSGERFTHVGMLADGARVIAYRGNDFAYWDANGVLHGPFQAHGASIREVCPARSGDHVITWDVGGTIRRFTLR